MACPGGAAVPAALQTIWERNGHAPGLVGTSFAMHAEFMRFTNPEFVWLVPVAAAVAWWWLRRARPAVRFSDSSLFAGIRGGRARHAGWGGAALRGLACLALIVGCA